MDDTGEIKGTGFNAVVDELYEKLQEDKVYFISKARVNLSKKKFSSVSNEYELSLERTTEIEEVSPLNAVDYSLSYLPSVSIRQIYRSSSTTLLNFLVFRI